MYFDSHRADQTIHKVERQLKQLGYKVQLEPDTARCTVSDPCNEGGIMNDYVKDVVMQVIYKKSPIIDLSKQEIDLLNSLPADRLVSVLQDIFAKESNATIRGRAFFAILAIQAFDRVQFLLDLFEGSSIEWQIAYCEELSRFHDPRAIAKLCSILLEDSDPDMRYTAAESLAKIGDARAIRALEYARDNDTGNDYEGFPIADMASEALQKIRSRINHEKPSE
jgi:HEAT repeat protein